MFCAHGGNSFRKRQDRFSMNFIMVLNLIWKSVLYEPRQPTLGTCQKGSCPLVTTRQGQNLLRLPNPQEEYFSFQMKTAPSPILKIVLPSTSNPIHPSFWKYFFSNERWTVLASEKGLLHKQEWVHCRIWSTQISFIGCFWNLQVYSQVDDLSLSLLFCLHHFYSTSKIYQGMHYTTAVNYTITRFLGNF